MNKPFVSNAADVGQVKEADRKVKNQKEQDVDDLLFILGTKQGRRYLWKVLGHCKTFESIWRSSAEIHYLAGKQDVGHFLMSDIVLAKPDALIEMMKESKGDLNV